mmetsp:Transcript_15193/g.23627  ORF Transcript_15193/g.23627 Transcript_15193/m.23627 type:complete len:124 (-) Transcript_15193:2133-2504(-)
MVQQPRTETVWYTVPSTVKQTKNNWNEDPVVNNIADEYSNASLDSSFNGSIGLFVNAAINGEQSQKQHPSHYDSQRSTFFEDMVEERKNKSYGIASLRIASFKVQCSIQCTRVIGRQYDFGRR